MPYSGSESWIFTEQTWVHFSFSSQETQKKKVNEQPNAYTQTAKIHQYIWTEFVAYFPGSPDAFEP